VKLHLRVRREAELDLYSAAAWYEAQHRGLGREFADAALGAMESLSYQALIHPEILPGIRRALMRRFPYSISFRISGGDVVVLSVLHQRRSQRLLPK
jgi:plasmid stabilization system protein ParE